jgi:hypothetical protein
MSRFQKCFPRPVIVCPDELSNTTSIRIAYDGSLPGGLCKCLSMQAHELVSLRTRRAAKYLRFHRYHVDEAPVTSRLRPAEVLKSEIANRKIRTAVMGATRKCAASGPADRKRSVDYSRQKGNRCKFACP